MSAETERLHRENGRLRLALTCLIAIGAAAAGFGAGSAQPSRNDPISIASDGEFLYRLKAGGWIERINIESRVTIENRQRTERNSPPLNPAMWETIARN
jgi:hypothetical protein